MTENTPELRTKRLILRRFTAGDTEAFFRFMDDEEVNRFLPLVPFSSQVEAGQYLQERYIDSYRNSTGYRYAICLKEDNMPVGYVNASDGESRDFGYALGQGMWGRGIATEASEAVVEQMRRDGIPFITATHDVNNPRSGAVMKRLGMTYRYSYEEMWKPKNFLVTFRMYQLDLDGREHPTYSRYREMYPVNFVEESV